MIHQEACMAIQTTYTHARANLAALCDEVTANREVVIIHLTFRTLFRSSEAILEEPPKERGSRAIHGLFHAPQLFVPMAFPH
jgi:hypothetical protein